MITVVLSEEYSACGDQHQGSQQQCDAASCFCPSFEVFQECEPGSTCFDQTGENCDDEAGEYQQQEAREDDANDRQKSISYLHLYENESPQSPLSVSEFSAASLGSPLPAFRAAYAEDGDDACQTAPIFRRRMILQIESMRRSVHFVDPDENVTFKSTVCFSQPERRASWYRKIELRGFRRDVEQAVSELRKNRWADLSDNLVFHDDSSPCVSPILELSCLGLSRSLRKLTAQATVIEQQRKQKSTAFKHYSEYCRKAQNTHLIDVLMLRRRQWKGRKEAKRKDELLKDRITPRYFCYDIEEEEFTEDDELEESYLEDCRDVE